MKLQVRLSRPGRSTAQLLSPTAPEVRVQPDSRSDFMSRGRAGTVRTLALLGLLAFGFLTAYVVGDALSQSGIDHVLVPAGSPEAQYGADHPGETVHIIGSVFALLIGISGLAALAIKPRWTGAANHALAALVAAVIVIVIVGNPNNNGSQAGFIDPFSLILLIPGLAAALTARPWRSWSAKHLTHPVFLYLALAALPMGWYGVDQALIQRNTWPPMADPHHQAHWHVTAVLAFSILLVVATAALSGKGRRLALGTAALSAIALGSASLLSAQAASALTTLWALLAIGWGATTLVVEARNVVPTEPGAG